jgi:UMF1 family MFS transporter
MKKLSVAEKSWILYDFANSSFGLIIMTAIMPVYYKSYIAVGVPEVVSTADWGFANAIGGLVVAICAPVMGAIADVKQQKKLFLGIFLSIGVLFTALIACTTPGARFFTLALYVFGLLGFAGGNVFYDSLLVDVTTKKRMDWISGAGYAWGYIGGALPFILSLALIFIGSRFKAVVTMQKVSFLITALWWAFFSVPVLKNTRQKFIIRGGQPTVAQALKNLLETFRKIRNYKNIVIFLSAYFLYIDGVDTIIRMAVPYGQEAGLSPLILMLSVLGLQILAFPFALIYGRLAMVFGAKKMLFIAIAIYTVIAFCGFLLPSIAHQGTKLTLFFVIAFLIATSQGGIQALSRSYFGKIIPRTQAAEFFGFYNIFGKFATIIGPLLIALAGHWLGHSKYGILSLVILFIAGGILLSCVKEKEAS